MPAFTNSSVGSLYSSDALGTTVWSWRAKKSMKRLRISEVFTGGRPWVLCVSVALGNAELLAEFGLPGSHGGLEGGVEVAEARSGLVPLALHLLGDTLRGETVEQRAPLHDDEPRQSGSSQEPEQVS